MTYKEEREHILEAALLAVGTGRTINDTKKYCRAHPAGFKPLKTAKTRQIQKKGHIRGIFGKITPFFGPEVVFLKSR